MNDIILLGSYCLGDESYSLDKVVCDTVSSLFDTAINPAVKYYGINHFVPTADEEPIIMRYQSHNLL